MLKNKTSPFGRARKASILKLRHIELAISGVLTLKIWDNVLEQVYQMILQLDLSYKKTKKNIYKDSGLALWRSHLKQFYGKFKTAVIL